MSLSLHNLHPAAGAKRKSKRVGRGNASGKGTTAGKGGKGQTARSGGRFGLNILGMKRLVLSTPKLRGFTSPHAKAVAVDLDMLNVAFDAGNKVTPKTLAKKGLIPSGAKVKLLGSGTLKKKLIVIDCAVSEGAKAKIAAAGGEVRE
jgi:large subunit ribosomal protein L15